MAFNPIVAKLFWFVEVTGSNADNATAWRATFGCRRCLDFYHKRLNPTWQSTKWVDSKKGYTGRWETSSACRAQVCDLRACWALIMINECCVRVH
jgi:hypothetical protein